MLTACGPAHPRRSRNATALRRALLVVAALAALGIEARAGEPAATDLRPLARLLPQTRNHKICFTARVDDMRVDLGDRASKTKDTARRLEGLAVELYWDDSEPMDYRDGWGYDRRYELTLAARVAGHLKPLVGGLECEYRDRALVDPKTGRIIDGPTATRLECSQDCDGGSLSLEAQAGDRSPSLVLEADQRVRLDGGELRPNSNPVRLRLEPAAASACQPIEDATD